VHGYDIKVVIDLLRHEDIRITEIYAKVSGNITECAITSPENIQERSYDLVILAKPPLPVSGENGDI
jgi:hypothetical protein